MLTTRYLEEADRLAHRIGVIDHGRLGSEGTAAQLKARVGGAILELSIRDCDHAEAGAALYDLGAAPPGNNRTRGTLVLHGADGVATVREALRRLNAADITPTNIGLRRPTLDDVFVTLTRHLARDDRPQLAPPQSAA